MPDLQFEESQRLPKYRRIKSSEEFEVILKANRLRNNWFTVYAQKNEIGISRIGLVVSKKLLFSSVKRNFAKRVIREEYRRKFPVRCSLDIVVRLCRPLDHNTAREGQMALAQLLDEIQIKCAGS